MQLSYEYLGLSITSSTLMITIWMHPTNITEKAGFKLISVVNVAVRKPRRKSKFSLERQAYSPSSACYSYDWCTASPPPLDLAKEYPTSWVEYLYLQEWKMIMTTMDLMPVMIIENERLCDA